MWRGYDDLAYRKAVACDPYFINLPWHLLATLETGTARRLYAVAVPAGLYRLPC